MSLLEMAALGAAVGVVHSFEADHLAAVASLVDEEHGGRAGLIGTSWGVGHAVPIAAVGGVFLAVGSRLPDGVTSIAEILAGAVLVLLGVRILLRAIEVTEHSHGGRDHHHLSVGPIDVGTTHSHREGESFLVGVLHGLAGSGVAIGALATSTSLVEGVSLLGAFAVASIATMGALTLCYGTVLSVTASHAIQAVAGIAAIGIGLLLVANELLGAITFGHDHSHDGDGGHEHAAEAFDRAVTVDLTAVTVDIVDILADSVPVISALL